MTARMHPLREVPLASVTIEDSFWSPRLRLLREVTVREVLSRFEGADGGAFQNFDWVKRKMQGKHVGFPWYDGLIYQTIGAASKLLAGAPDRALDEQLDGYIRRIADAQAADPDGYLNTNTTLLFPDKKWGANGGNLRWQHDVYNAGCLVEAAVSHYRATGKTSLLDVAVRFADSLCGHMGPPPRVNIVPAHPLPELAFVELYRLFRDDAALRASRPGVDPKRYLSLARFWIDNRGNHRTRANYVPAMQEYAQDHLPVPRQDKAVGHAVRATLLYAGLTAVAEETGKGRYRRAALALWKDVVTRKLHVTGGVGAMREEEMFGPAFYLPNDAYLETCAAVGMAAWSHRMTLAFRDGAYADALERSLYNNVLSGLSIDGKRFFYQNPLVSRGDHHRWEWHSCPCCPPMLQKLVAGFGGFLYAHDSRGIWVNHYVGGSATIPWRGTTVGLRQETRYPWDGHVTLTVGVPSPRRLSICLRIPGWCESFAVSINGGQPARAEPESGYVLLDRTWSQGDLVTLDMHMPVTLLEANPYVEADRGRVAILRGPVVYCVEEADNAEGVMDLRLPTDPRLTHEFVPGLLGGVSVVRGTAADGKRFTAIPYFAWDNRGAESGPAPHNAMMVWIPRESTWDPVNNVWSRPDDLRSWEDRLYRVCWVAEEPPVPHATVRLPPGPREYSARHSP